MSFKKLKIFLCLSRFFLVFFLLFYFNKQKFRDFWVFFSIKFILGYLGLDTYMKKKIIFQSQFWVHPCILYLCTDRFVYSRSSFTIHNPGDTLLYTSVIITKPFNDDFGLFTLSCLLRPELKPSYLPETWFTGERRLKLIPNPCPLFFCRGCRERINYFCLQFTFIAERIST